MSGLGYRFLMAILKISRILVLILVQVWEDGVRMRHFKQQAHSLCVKATVFSNACYSHCFALVLPRNPHFLVCPQLTLQFLVIFMWSLFWLGFFSWKLAIGCSLSWLLVCLWGDGCCFQAVGHEHAYFQKSSLFRSHAEVICVLLHELRCFCVRTQQRPQAGDCGHLSAPHFQERGTCFCKMEQKSETANSFQWMCNTLIFKARHAIVKFRYMWVISNQRDMPLELQNGIIVAVLAGHWEYYRCNL